MRRLSIRGEVFEISEHHYLGLIYNLAKGYFLLAEAYYNYCESGFADWKGALQIPEVGQTEFNEVVEEQIDDDELFKAFTYLKDQLQEIKKVNENTITWLAEFVGIPSVQNKKDKANLERRLKNIIVGGPEGHPQGPIWVLDPEYQALVERAKSILAGMRTALHHVDQRIQQLDAHTPRS